MKIGNFSAIWISPSLAVSLDRQCFGDALVAQLGQTHGIEQLTDRRLQLLHGSLQVAAKLLRASSVVEAALDVVRPLERADDLPDGDVARVARQYVPSLGSVLADDQPALGESLQDLSQELGRDAELFRDPLRADSAELVVDGDIVNRHQPIIGALGKAEHRQSTLASELTSCDIKLSITDLFSRRSFQSYSHTGSAWRQPERLVIGYPGPPRPGRPATHPGADLHERRHHPEDNLFRIIGSPSQRRTTEIMLLIDPKRR